MWLDRCPASITNTRQESFILPISFNILKCSPMPYQSFKEMDTFDSLKSGDVDYAGMKT